MSTIEGARRREIYRQLSGPLLDDTRRRIVHVLREDAETVTESELVDRIVSGASGSTDADQPLVFRLYETHLPDLVDNGLVHWDQQRETVTATHHPVYHRQQPAALLARHGLHALSEALDSARRRTLVAVFDAESGRVSREALARRVASTESYGPPADSFVDAVDATMHETHLETLETVDVVDYDRDDGVVAYRGPTELTTVLARRASPTERLAAEPITQR